MITPKTFAALREELTALLNKHRVSSFVFATIAYDQAGDLVELPVLANVEGNPQSGVSAAREAALFIDNVPKLLIRLLMQYCGLTLPQAVGALQASVRVAASELQEQERQFLRGSGVTAEG